MTGHGLAARGLAALTVFVWLCLHALPVFAQSEAAPSASAQTEERLALKRNETLVQVLMRAGATSGEAHEIAASLRPLVDLRDLAIGQEFVITRPTDAETEGSRLSRVSFRPSPDRDAVVERLGAGAWAANIIPRRLERETVRVSGTITHSLARAADQSGLPAELLVEMVRQFSYDVDFQRDIQPGDRFDVVFERLRDPDGEVVRAGPLVAASLTLSGQAQRIFRFTPRGGEPEYFGPGGAAVRKALLKTPIDGARLTSRFGMRNHPILGFSRMHAGVDFGAPTGTPVQAAGDGVVERVSHEPRGYGNLVRIRHSGEFATLYAHLSRFGPGIRPGQRVRQGQVIGFVGSTGLSTGPHLHYEVHRAGRPVNPTALRMPTGRSLTGPDLRSFQAHVAEQNQRWEAMPMAVDPRVARRPDDEAR
ncbi:MAG: M23 family metallopeptidase [Alphaproteobacteria bacterium]|nr:MAG: M23 family metallopeptidase [Alphaproteobacteria bacterium]